MKRALVVVAALMAVACGSKGPTAPQTPDVLAAPTNFTITLQRVFLTSNTVAFSWSSTGATSYKFFVGSSAGASDVLTADVTGTSYTWTAPRTANIYYARVAAVSGGQTGTVSQELPLFTIDMRYVIDSLYFGFGPMSDNIGVQPPGNFPAAVWADGSTISLVVTDESGSVSLDAARAFVAEYLATMSNHITVNISTTPVRWTGVGLLDVPLDTVVIRVDNSICPQTGVIACAFYGPAPYGPGRSTVNLNAAPTPTTPGGSVAIAHEIGHAFGLHHVKVNASGRSELRFLMNPALLVGALSEVEKNAIVAARAGGMRNGWTRSQAVAAGLVLQTANPAFFPMPQPILPALRDALESGFIR